jgi:hypothetical protein
VLQAFVINTPTLAMGKSDRVPVTIPRNASVTVGKPLDTDGTLVEVYWEGRALLMFMVDLQKRGTAIPGDSTS